MEWIKEISGLINEEVLKENISKNTDPYGKACVDVAINIMKFLDNFDGKFKIGYHPDLRTPHGVICECDNQGGISGFMAAAARNIVSECHELGWKFYLADVISPYDIDNKKRVKDAIKNIVDTNLVGEEEARLYVDGLINEYRSKNES